MSGYLQFAVKKATTEAAGNSWKNVNNCHNIIQRKNDLFRSQ